MNDKKSNKIINALCIIITGIILVYDISYFPYALIGFGIGYLVKSL